MTEEAQPRSPAAVQASRRNGANSKGPRSAEGKARSAQNARKHGLFSLSGNTWQGRSPEGKALAGTVRALLQGRDDSYWTGERVLEAAQKLENVTAIIRHLSAVLDALLDTGSADSRQRGQVIVELARMRRYQRRFRGQRDRALRAVLKTAQP